MNVNPSAAPSILNLTPHPVTVKRSDGRGTVTFPPDGTVANCQTNCCDGETSEWCGVNIVRRADPVVRGLPPQVPGRLVIVSPSILRIMRGVRTDLVTPQWDIFSQHSPPVEYLVSA